jgi:hypothetical protein
MRREWGNAVDSIYSSCPFLSSSILLLGKWIWNEPCWIMHPREGGTTEEEETQTLSLEVVTLYG